MLKTIEKLIVRHIRDDLLIVNPLNRHQYAYRMEKLCKMSIQDLARKIENPLANKEIVLGVFLDIEGAFDNTSFGSIK